MATTHVFLTVHRCNRTTWLSSYCRKLYADPNAFLCGFCNTTHSDTWWGALNLTKKMSSSHHLSITLGFNTDVTTMFVAATPRGPLPRYTVPPSFASIIV